MPSGFTSAGLPAGISLSEIMSTQLNTIYNPWSTSYSQPVQPAPAQAYHVDDLDSEYNEPEYDEDEDDFVPIQDDPPEPAYQPSTYQYLASNFGKKKMDKIPFYNKKLISYWRGLTSTKGEIGLEIECEGTSLFDSPLRWWSCHNDGSLRAKNGHPPIEYVLKEPLSREDVPKALTYLTKQLKSAGSSVAESTRTSVHVHVNCQEDTVKEIFTFVSLYLLFENLLVEFSGPTRSGNLFCLRAKDAEYWVWSIVKGFQGKDMSQVFSDNFRYTSCNTASLAKFGSLEFRSMRGTVDQETIQLWVDILLHLKEESKKYKDPAELYEHYFTLGPMDYFKYIFYNKTEMYSALKNVCTESQLYQGVKEGGVFVRDIASAVDPWKEKEDVPEEIEPEKPSRVLRYESAKIRSTRVVWNSHPHLYIEDKLHPLNESFGCKDIPPRKFGIFDEYGWIAMANSDMAVVEWWTE